MDRLLTAYFLDLGREIGPNISTEMGGEMSQTFPINLVVCLMDSSVGRLARQLLLVLHCLLEDRGSDIIYILSCLFRHSHDQQLW